MKKRFLTILAAALISIMSLTSIVSAADSNYGASGAQTKTDYTLTEMLTYAIQDEYLALAEYEKIMDTFVTQKPFSNIIKSENTHIALLKPLFNQYDIQIPADTSSGHVIIPTTLLAAYKTGVQAEINNIAMYDTFLKQKLPDDVRSVFLRLKAASQNHLKAFQNSVTRMESGSRNNGKNANRRGK